MVEAAVSKYLIRGLVADLVSKPNHALVFSLVAEGARTIEDVREEAGLSRTTVSRILRKLEERGLVTRVGGIDGRKTYWCLAELGEKLTEYLRDILNEAFNACAYSVPVKGKDGVVEDIAEFRCVVDEVASVLGAKVRRWARDTWGVFLRMLGYALEVIEGYGTIVVCNYGVLHE